MLTAVFLGMELCWVGLAFGLAWVGWGGGAWPLPLLAPLPSPLGVAAARLTPLRWRRHRWFDTYRWGLALGAAAGCASLAVATAATPATAGWTVLAFGGVCLFWRGWSIGDDLVDAPGVEAAFQIGAVAVLVLLAVLQRSVPVAGAGLIPAVGFFLLGLLAIGLARRSERREQGAGLETDWLALTVALGLSTLVAAAVLVSLVSPDLLQTLVDQGRWLLGVVGMLFGGLTQLLGGLFGWLGGLFGSGTTLDTPSPSPDSVPSGDSPAPEPPLFNWNMSPLVRWVFERLLEGHLLLLLGYVLYRLARFGLRRVREPRWGRGRQRRAAPRSDAPPFSWRRWWRLFLTRAFGRLRRGLGRRSDADRRARGAAGAEQAGPTLTQRSIRALYREFLGTSASVGVPHAPHQTPDEFAAHLARRRPAAQPALQELTRLYVRARYAGERLDEPHVAAMRAAVERATTQLRAEVGDRRHE